MRTREAPGQAKAGGNVIDCRTSRNHELLNQMLCQSISEYQVFSLKSTLSVSTRRTGRLTAMNSCLCDGGSAEWLQQFLCSSTEILHVLQLMAIENRTPWTPNHWGKQPTASYCYTSITPVIALGSRAADSTTARCFFACLFYAGAIFWCNMQR